MLLGATCQNRLYIPTVSDFTYRFYVQASYLRPQDGVSCQPQTMKFLHRILLPTRVDPLSLEWRGPVLGPLKCLLHAPSRCTREINPNGRHPTLRHVTIL
jgi:hypothetical protein